MLTPSPSWSERRPGCLVKMCLLAHGCVGWMSWGPGLQPSPSHSSCLGPQSIPPPQERPWAPGPPNSLPQLTCLGLSSPRWSPKPPLLRSRTFSPRLRKSRAQTHGSCDPSGQGASLVDPSCLPLPQGPAEMPLVWPKPLGAGLGPPPPCGHPQERPCRASRKDNIPCTSVPCLGATPGPARPTWPCALTPTLPTDPQWYPAA